MAGGRICVVGSCNVDLTVHVPHRPATGATVTGTAFAQRYGGKGANQAVMAARLGAQVAMVARVGDDAFGHDYRRHLAAEGVDVDWVGLNPAAATGVASIWVEESTGDNAIVVVPGANGTLGPDDVEAAADVLAAADVVVCQWEVPLAAVTAALRVARDAGVATVLNPAPARPDAGSDLYRDCDVVCPNESELAALTGLPAGTAAEVEAAAGVLRDRGADAVVCTLGARGALVVDDEGAGAVAAEAVTAVDTTGAGDAFVGAMAVELARGADLRTAVSRAVAIATMTVRRPGAQASYPTRDELAGQRAGPSPERGTQGASGSHGPGTGLR